MLEYSFSVKHEGCWTADIHERFPDLRATILQSHALTDSSSTIIKIDDIDRSRTEAIVDWMHDHPVVRTVEVVDHDGESGLISLCTDYSDSDTEPVGNVFREQFCIPLASPEVQNGFEHCQLMMTNREQVQATYTELREFGPVEIRSLNELDTEYHVSDLAAVSRAVAKLAPRLRQMLERAIDRGYYDVPKSCTLDELAAEDEVSMSTVAEHLRQAEYKIFDAIAPLLSEGSE